MNVRRKFFYITVGLSLIGCGSTEEAVDGADLFAQNCARCHGGDATGGSGPNIQGKTAEDINQAINAVNVMSGFQGAFDSEQINAIASHLQSLQSSGKLAKAGANLVGVIDTPESRFHLVELKDAAGEYRSIEAGDAFSFDVSALNEPFMVRVTDEFGRVLFGFSPTSGDAVSVSEETTRTIEGYADANLLFENCGSDESVCFGDLSNDRFLEQLGSLSR